MWKRRDAESKPPAAPLVETPTSGLAAVDASVLANAISGTATAEPAAAANGGSEPKPAEEKEKPSEPFAGEEKSSEPVMDAETPSMIPDAESKPPAAAFVDTTKEEEQAKDTMATTSSQDNDATMADAPPSAPDVATLVETVVFPKYTLGTIVYKVRSKHDSWRIYFEKVVFLTKTNVHADWVVFTIRPSCSFPGNKRIMHIHGINSSGLSTNPSRRMASNGVPKTHFFAEQYGHFVHLKKCRIFPRTEFF
jgi:hypothetical protein